MLGTIYELCEILSESERMDLTEKVRSMGEEVFRDWTEKNASAHFELASSQPAKRKHILQRLPGDATLHVLAAAQIVAWCRQVLSEIEQLDRPQSHQAMLRTAYDLRVALLNSPDEMWPVPRTEAPFEGMVDLSG
jgi:hypothetical protein